MGRVSGATMSPEEQLALLLDGAPLEGPVAAELAELVQMASTVGSTLAPAAPTSDFRASLRARLQDEARAVAAEAEAVTLTASATPRASARDRVAQRLARWRRSTALAMASLAGASAFGTAGVAAAAQSAQPGEPLYDVKLATERVRLAWARGDEHDGRLYLAFAERRVAEVSRGRATLTDDQLIDALGAADRNGVEGSAALVRAYEDSHDRELLDEVDAFARRQRRQLRQLLPDLPPAVVPFAEDSLDVVRQIIDDLDAVTGGGPVDPEVPATDRPTESGRPEQPSDEPSRGSTDPSDTPAEPGSGPGSDPTEAPTVDPPTELPTDAEPTGLPTAEVPSELPTDDLPTDLPTDDLPTDDASIPGGLDGDGDLGGGVVTSPVPSVAPVPADDPFGGLDDVTDPVDDATDRVPPPPVG